MIRRIIEINREKCNGCGLCAQACHEGAIGMVEGKALLLRDDYCDGLGDCLPTCPTGAITFVEREAAPYDAAAVQSKKRERENGEGHGCPGSRIQTLGRRQEQEAAVSSQLRQWPVQIKLAPLTAPYFDGANLLIAADCTAFAYGNFHQDFIRGKVTLVGCPKLDGVDYSEKLTEIIRQNNIKSVTIARMEVSCCGGLQIAAEKALRDSGKFIPWQVVTISVDGRILE